MVVIPGREANPESRDSGFIAARCPGMTMGESHFFADARSRSSCSRTSGVSASPKSSAANTWRISISSPLPNGARCIHWIASSSDLVLLSQKPATSSPESANGPRLTLPCPLPYLIRAPFAVGCRPSPASITPALTSSSLNLPIAVSSSVLGITPASESLLAFTITMNRIAILRVGIGRPPSLRPSSTRRAGFYAADMSGEIIFEVIVLPAPSSSRILSGLFGHHLEIRLGLPHHPREGGPPLESFEIGRVICLRLLKRHHHAAVEQRRRGGTIGEAKILARREAAL